MKTGCPMHIVSRIPCQKEHSKKAKHRLEIIDLYNQNSAYKSVSGKKDASLTCRHFGIERSYFTGGMQGSRNTELKDSKKNQGDRSVSDGTDNNLRTGENHGIMCYGKKGFDEEAENDCTHSGVHTYG